MFNRYKIFAAYIFAIPLALLLGILSASPDEVTFMLIGILLFFLALPLFINWHHALLIVFWNSAFSAFFLPGQPAFWLICAGLSFGISFLNYIMGRKLFLSVPEMTRPLLFMAAVVLGTACYRGGIGIKALGGATHGGRYYVFILGAIVGYFALTAVQIPNGKSARLTSLFFLSGGTYVLSNLAYTMGSAFFFLYYLVPSTLAYQQVASDFGITNIDRILGLAQACNACVCFLLVRYGVKGLFDWSKPWRLAFFLITVGAMFFSGFRSALAVIIFIFAIQFYLEGLFRTRIFPIVIGLAVSGFLAIFIFADKMPMSVQRTISFLPVNIDSSVRADAMGSSEWRFQMWAVVSKEIPKYLWVGKGYSFDPSEMDLTMDAIQRGLLGSAEESMLAGDYHSGPLSVIIPFGIAGCVAFLWVLGAGWWVMGSNFRHGEERLRRLNSVLLSYYSANAVSFFFLFGALNSQLFIFLGVIGLSVSLNGGVKRKTDFAPARRALSAARDYAIELG